MKTGPIALLCLLLPVLSLAQESNVFYDRAFWKTAPDIATVKEKIKEGNDPVALNPNAFDATVYAILENAPLETIQWLLSLEGNKVDKVTHDGRNYLLWAAYKGNVDLMKLLISKGSDPEMVDDHGYNLMTFAATAGQQDPAVYDLILANGVDVNSTNRSGANALLLLAPHLKDKKDLQYYLDKGLDIHSKDLDGNGIFNYASLRGNVDLMKQMIDMGIDYKGLNKKGENALLYATHGARGYSNPVEVYQYLIDLGLEADIVSWEGRTPLHNVAGTAPDMAIIEFFTQRGVNIDQVDEEGNTAFINVVRNNKPAIVKKLVADISDINHTDRNGYSALTYAIMRNAPETFDLLRENGAKMTLRDAKGNNLVFHIFNSYNPGNQDAFDKFVQVAQQEGLDFVSPFTGNNNLAHIAIEKNSKFLLTKAIALGVDVNRKNQEGLTPLHLAAMKSKDKELLTLLLEQGADKGIRTEFDESAYDLAAENEALTEKAINLEFLKIK